jgi:hypothetical protein
VQTKTPQKIWLFVLIKKTIPALVTTSLTYAAHQRTFVAKSAPWKNIINHGVVVTCNDDKSFETGRLGDEPKQRCCTRKIASECYVLLLSILLIDFINCDLFDLSPVTFKFKTLACVFPRKRKRWFCEEHSSRHVQVRYCVVGPIIAAALFIHFISIFHLKLISKIVQLDYRTAASFSPLKISSNSNHHQHIYMQRGKAEN